MEVFPVRAKTAGIFGVAQVRVDDADNATPDFGILNGKDALNASEEVAGHPVGAAGEDMRCLSMMVLKVEDAAVLQIASEDTVYANVFTEAFYVGDKVADAADDKVDFNSGSGGAVKIIDGFLIYEAVDLYNDAGGFSGAGVACLGVDVSLDGVVEIKGGNQEFFKVGFDGESGEGIEEIGDLVGDFTACGKEAEVGVKAGGFGIVVSGAEVGVASQVAALAADHHTGFAMGLESNDAIHDMDALVFKLACPFDVVGFIKAGFEFNEDGDLFAIAGGFDEGLHDGRIAGGAVKGLLDGKDGGIVGRLTDKIDERLKAVVGLMQEVVALGDLLEEGLVAFEVGVDVGGKGFEFQVGPVDEVVGTHEARHVERTIDGVNIDGVEFEGFEQLFEENGVCALRDFEANRGAFLAVEEFFFNFTEEILDFFFIKVEVAVAGDAEGDRGANAVTGEEITHVLLNDIAEGNVDFGVPTAGGVDADDARKDSGDGNDRHEAFNGTGLGIINGGEDVEGLVDELWEGVGGVNCEGGEDREDLLGEVFGGPLLLVAGELIVGAEFNTGLVEAGYNFTIPAGALIGDQTAGAGLDAPELFLGAESVGATFMATGFDLLHDARHADFKKFVEVGTDECQKLHAFK